MNKLLAICLIIAAPFAWAGDHPAAPQGMGTAVKGQVLEVKDVESYTYLRLKTEGGETWAAVPKAVVRKNDNVTIANVTVMNNFQSRSLQKTFPTILFGTLGGAGSTAAAASPGARAAESENIHVPKASGANAWTVAEVISRSAQLKDKVVLVRGKVVKYNPEIMGKNWVHLRDGSGSAANGTNDLLVTTRNQAKPGDVVTAKGIVRVNKDFGAGYSYKVLMEEATLQQ